MEYEKQSVLKENSPAEIVLLLMEERRGDLSDIRPRSGSSSLLGEHARGRSNWKGAHTSLDDEHEERAVASRIPDGRTRFLEVSKN